MEYRRLGNTDLEISVLGYGASPLGDVYGRVDPSEAKSAVHRAIENGINFFDVSPYYGLTLAEQRLGDALHGKRNGIVLATKFGRYGLDEFDFSPARLRTSVEESLRRLKTDYVDLLQAHDVEFGDFHRIVNETIPAMRELQKQGKARHIGITGYPPNLLVKIAEKARVDTILSYCHYNLLNNQMDEFLTPFAKENGIGLINASALHMGILTERGAPDWHPAPAEVRAAGRRVANLCRQQGTEVAKVAIRYCLDHPYVSTTLVGMASRAEVRLNVELLKARTDLLLLDQIESTIGSAANLSWPSGNSDHHV
jgi:L-galactose dehydrogenase